MKKTLIFGLMAISCTTQAFQGAITHETCKIALPSSGFNNDSVADKGFKKSFYTLQYKKSGDSTIQSHELPTSNGDLINRTSYLDGGAAALEAQLSSLSFRGYPKLKIFKADGSEIQVDESQVFAHGGGMIEQHAELSDTAVIRAGLFNVLAKSELVGSDQHWFKLKLNTVAETPIVQSQEFTLRAVAQELLKNDQGLGSHDRQVIEVIAGISKMQVAKEELNAYRIVLINHKLIGNMTDIEFTKNMESAFPTCVTKK